MLNQYLATNTKDFSFLNSIQVNSKNLKQNILTSLKTLLEIL